MVFVDALTVVGGLTVAFVLHALVRLVFALANNSDCATALTPKVPKNAFDGRVVWVTGASSGVGKEVALLLAKHNALIIISSRSHATLEKVKDECLLINKDAMVHIVPLDLGQVDTLQEKALEVLKEFGHIDILINNAGCSTRVLAHHCHFELDQYVTKVDYIGHVALVKALLPHFRARSGITIMNTGSIASKVGVPVRTAYTGAKHALHGYMNALRMECMVTGADIYIGNVCLGSTCTDLPFHALVDKTSNKTEDSSSIQTFGRADPNTAKGMPPQFVAERILAVAHQRSLPEVWLAKPNEIMLLLLNQYLPNLTMRLLFVTMCKQYTVHKENED